MTAGETTATGERADLLHALAKQRYFLRHTARDLTDEQATRRTTASELSIGGVIKHVTIVERQWASFMVSGAAAMASGGDEGDGQGWLDGFRMLPGETLAGLLAAYDEVARTTDAPRPWADPARPEPTRHGVMTMV